MYNVEWVYQKESPVQLYHRGFIYIPNEARNQIHPLNINKSVDNSSSWAVSNLALELSYRYSLPIGYYIQ